MLQPHLSISSCPLSLQHPEYPDVGVYIPVKTNCPTVAANPDKKALNGYRHSSPVSTLSFHA